MTVGLPSAPRPGVAWIAPGVTAASLVAVLALAVAPRSGAIAPVALIGVIALAAGAAAVDAATQRLPDRLLAAAAIVLIAAVVALAGRSDAVAGDVLLACLVGAACAAGPLLALHLANPASIGFGDVKLAGVLGGALGLLDPRAALVAVAIAALVGIGQGVVARRTAVAFGPALVAGAAVAALVELGGWAPWP